MDIGVLFLQSFGLISNWDSNLSEIVFLSLQVTVTAVVLACLLGLPIGAMVGTFRFFGRSGLILGMNVLMGLPPVIVGLVVYLLLSASGPMGVLGLLYTPFAMIIAQTVLVTPIIAALSRQVIEDLWMEYAEQFASLGVSRRARIFALLWDARFSLLTVVLAGFGRAVAEVGAVMIVGGNINHVTRVMTTAIALETSRGQLELALALGLVLLIVSLVVNIVVMAFRGTIVRGAYA
ncbi:MAG: ABC transporter permease [Aestuariivita sp.]|nr:ABC transporter permease [Aestuariivita sp.]